MEEFKTYGENDKLDQESKQTPKEASTTVPNFSEIKPGWYETQMIFKRVTRVSETDKCQYIDTPFSAYIKGESEQDCYNKMVDYIHQRQDVDPRSQIPSIKSANFTCAYLAEHLPLDEYKEV